MWLLFHSYWIFIAVMFVVIILFAIRYSGTKRMTLEAAVELLQNGGPLVVAHAVGSLAVSNDAITVHYSQHKGKAGTLRECIRCEPAPHTEYLSGFTIWFESGLVQYLQRTNCAERPREQLSYAEKMQCGHIMRIVSMAVDRSRKNS